MEGCYSVHLEASDFQVTKVRGLFDVFFIVNC